jgi:hypothetical protein
MTPKDILFYTVIFLCLSAVGYILFWSYSENGKCLASPLVYSVNQLENPENSPVTCSCYSPRVIGTIIANSTGTYTAEQSWNVSISI